MDSYLLQTLNETLLLTNLLITFVRSFLLNHPWDHLNASYLLAVKGAEDDDKNLLWQTLDLTFGAMCAPLKEISFGLVLIRLFETARRFDMEVQPQLVLLQKTLLAIEGLGRELYPELDLWTTAKPIMEEWMRERSNPIAHVKRLIDDWPEISDDLIALPGIVHAFVRDREKQRMQPKRSDRTAWQRQARAGRRMLAGSVFLIAGVLWLGLAVAPAWVGWVAAAAGAAGVLHGALRQ
jgi:ubiquinone biosynthesis protein